MPTRRIDNDPEYYEWDVDNCRHPEHNPPNMLYIPAGQVRHFGTTIKKRLTGNRAQKTHVSEAGRIPLRSRYE